MVSLSRASGSLKTAVCTLCGACEASGLPRTAAGVIRWQNRRTMSQLTFENTDDDGLSEIIDDESEKVAPWRTLLEPAARAAWRAATASPPEALAEARLKILEKSERTGRQLRRTHRRLLETHTALAGRRDRERRRLKNPQFPKDSLAFKEERSRDSSVSSICYGPEQTLATLKQRLLPNYAVVQRILSETRSLIGPTRVKPQRVIDFGVGTGSAAAAALDVFDSIDWVHGIDPSQSMRDSAAIILKAVSSDRSSPTRVTLSGSLSTQKSEASLGGFDLALFSYTAMELPHVASTVSAAAILWEKLKPNGLFVMIEPGTPDGFNSIRTVRSMLLDCCPPGRAENAGDDQCHVIAPCTHNGECPMERHRRRPRRTSITANTDSVDEDIDEFAGDFENFMDGDFDDDGELMDDEDDYDLNEQVGHLATDETEPTTRSSSKSSETDVFDNAYCSFVHTMPGGSRRSKGEKFSYFVAQKRIVGDPETDEDLCDRIHNPFHGTRVTDLLKTTFQEVDSQKLARKRRRDNIGSGDHVDLLEAVGSLQSEFIESEDDLGLDLIQGDMNRKTFGRLIRAPIKNRGHVLLDYCCGADEAEEKGRIVRHRVSKGRSARVAPGLFAAARKARWGGLWPDVMEKAQIDEDSSVDEDDKANEIGLEQ